MLTLSRADAWLVLAALRAWLPPADTRDRAALLALTLERQLTTPLTGPDRR